VHGSTAVVTGLNTLESSATASGKHISGAYRFTDVFVKRHGRWQVVASQLTRVLKR
jgi:ketosteroid isomerase-like protein